MTATAYARNKRFHETRAVELKQAVSNIDWMTVIYRGCFGVAAVIYAGLAVIFFIAGGWAGVLYGILMLMFSGLFMTFALS